MKFWTAFLACIAISFYSFSQSIPKNPNVTDAKGLRQGKWTILFNEKGLVTASQDSIEYFRIIQYKNDKPYGLVRDFYADGKLQCEGILLQDRPEEIWDVILTSYRKDGSKKSVQTFKNNKVVKEVVYNLDGTEAKEPFSKITELAMQAYGTGDYQKCVVLFERRLEQAKRQLGDRHPNYAESMNDLGIIYGSLGQFDKAEKAHLEAMSILEQTVGMENIFYTSSLVNLGEVYKAQGKYAQAKSLYARTIAIEVNLLGANNPEFALSLRNFAGLYNTLGQYDSALILYELVRKIYERNDLTNSVQDASAMNGIAVIQENLGKVDVAEKLYIEALKIRAKQLGTKHPAYLISLNNVGGIQVKRGDFEGAKSKFREIVEVYKNVLGTENLQYSLALNNLALVFLNEGSLVEAEKLFSESIVIRDRILGKNSTENTQSMHNLAQVYMRQGNYSKAEALYKEVLDLQLKYLGNEHARYALTLNDLGPLYIRMKRYKEAEMVLLEAQAIQEKVVGKKNTVYATILHNRAAVYVATGGYSKAEELYQQSRDIEIEILGQNHADYAHTMNSLAELNLKKGDFKVAEKYYKEALEIRTKTIGKRSPFYTKSLYGLAETYFLSKRNELAEPLYNEMSNGLLDQVRSYFPTLSEYEKEAFYFTLKEEFESFNSFAVERASDNASITQEIFNNQIATKAILFNSSNKIRNSILSSNDTVLIDVFRRWHIKRNQLSKAYQMDAEQRTKSNIVLENLENEINDIERQLSERAQGFSSNEKKRYTWRDIQRTLLKGEAVVEIVRVRKSGVAKMVVDTTTLKEIVYPLRGLTDTVYYAMLVITPKSKNPELILLKNGNELEGKFLRNYKNAVQFKIKDSISYDVYWQPIARYLKRQKIQNVYLSPDGVYNVLNANVLLNSKTRKFASDENEIRYISNSKDLLLRDKKASGARNVFLFGNPDFSEQDTISITNGQRSLIDQPESIQRLFAGGKISSLPGTKVEIDVIEELLKQQQVTLSKKSGRLVTEENLKALKNPAVLHIATHGFFLEDSGVQSFAGFDAKVNKNPLFRSGLLLAGSQKTISGQRVGNAEDGILTAYEAMNLNLDKTDLVVLSACETGLGEIRNGEGVYGLQRAFQTAGAKSVLMSLWKVDDNATQELMTSFYKNWLESGDKRDAFKKAQASVRKKYSHPYYWGAFVLVGE